MDRAARTRVIALVVLLLLSVPLVVLAAGGGDEEESAGGGLRVEPSQGAPELLVFVEDPELNALETTAGAKEVLIECFDRSGAVLIRTREPWPFTDTDNGLFDPHVHVFVEPAAMRRVERCRLKDTDPPLEGPKV